MASTYLLVIGDREALGWILSAKRMAFPDFRRAETRSLKAGDQLLIYTTRGCFKNPTRDRGRIIGSATVTSAVTTLEEPVEFAGRSFPVGCTIKVTGLAPFGNGVELAPLIDELDAIAGSSRAWGMQLRRPLVLLSEADTAVLIGRLREVERSPSTVIEDYVRWFHP